MRFDPSQSRAFRLEHCRDRVAAALANDHDAFPLAVLIAEETTVFAIFVQVRGLHVTAEIGAIRLSNFALATDDATAHLFRHRFAHLVAKDECGLVGEAQVTAERQHALALHLVAEDRDGSQVGFQGQLMRGEQRAAGDREVGLARLATEAERTRRAAALVSIKPAALGTYRRAVRRGPAHLPEHRLGFRVRHTEHMGQREGLGFCGEEEVLRHVCHQIRYLCNECSGIR